MPRDLLFGGSLAREHDHDLCPLPPVRAASTGPDTVIVLGRSWSSPRSWRSRSCRAASRPSRCRSPSPPACSRCRRPVLGATEGQSRGARVSAGDRPELDRRGDRRRRRRSLPAATRSGRPDLELGHAPDGVLEPGGGRTVRLRRLAALPTAGDATHRRPRDRRTGGAVGQRELAGEPGVRRRPRGTNIAGSVVANGGPDLLTPLSLYRVDPPLRIQGTTDGFFADGWMSEHATLTQYVAEPGGTAQVTVARTALDRPGRARQGAGSDRQADRDEAGDGRADASRSGRSDGRSTPAGSGRSPCRRRRRRSASRSRSRRPSRPRSSGSVTPASSAPRSRSRTCRRPRRGAAAARGACARSARCRASARASGE